MWQKWTAAVLGLLVLAVPFLNLDSTTATWTLVVSGAAIAALSFWAASSDTARLGDTAYIDRLQRTSR